MSAVALLCEIIAQAGKVAAQTYREDKRYGVLIEAGLLQRDGLVQSVLCESCDAPHDAAVVFEAGSYGHYCPDHGFVTVERAELVAVRPNLEVLMDQLSAALNCEPGGARQLGPDTWRIGYVNTPGGRAVVYLHPCLLDGDDLDALLTALRGEIRRDYTLILTASGSLKYRNAITCNLAQLVSLDANTSEMNAHVNVAQAVGAPPSATGGRPNIHGERLQSLLAERAQRGQAREGRNEEARAVLAAYVARFPPDPPPKLSTVKAYVTEFRRG